MAPRWILVAFVVVQAEAAILKDDHSSKELASLTRGEGENHPGAGIAKVEPFKNVFNDGFLKIDCVKDYMFHFGDRHGDNKDKYELRDVSNVSIVHYSENVPKQDRKPMAPKVCFDFCRTIPHMLFFGLRNGRDCYCEPYYKKMPSDTSKCHAVCDGDQSQFCGGKDKSDIFEMHMGADTEEELEKGAEKLGVISKNLTKEYHWFKEHMEIANRDIEYLENVLGVIQDFAATNMIRQAWNRAYDLNKMAKAAEALSSNVAATKKKTEGMVASGAEWTDYKHAKEAEAQIAKMKELAKKGEKALDEMHDANTLYKHMEIAGDVKEHEGRASGYYHAFYFAMEDPHSDPHTKENWGKDKSTCAGELIGEPIFGMDEDSCAYTCDSTKDCVAYQFYFKETTLCMLMSHVDDVSHYDSCRPMSDTCLPPPPANKAVAGFLQKGDADPAPFVWKTKSTEANSTLFTDSVQGLCTEVHGCEGEDQSIGDCSLMGPYDSPWGSFGSYECVKVKSSDLKLEGDTLSMEFTGWLNPGQRSSSCQVNAQPCGQCKKYSTCAGPYAETEPLKILEGHVAKYAWSSSGAVDNYEVFVGLYSETCGLVDYQFQRGEKQELRDFELKAPKTDKYSLRVMLGSYDGSGGGAVGADMTVKGVRRDKPDRPPPNLKKASCKLKVDKFNGMDLRPKEQKCEYCFHKSQKKCLKPNGDFPESFWGPKMIVEGRGDEPMS